MRLGNYFWLFFALAFFPAHAYSADYYWLYGSVTTQYSDAETACSSNLPANTSTYRYRHSRVEKSSSPTQYWCYVIRTTISTGTETELYIIGGTPRRANRYGDTCPSGTVYDELIGKCVVPDNPCAEKAGLETGFSKAGTAPDDFMNISSNGYGIPQRQGCKDGCAVELTDMRCKTFTSGPYICRGLSGFTGQQCSSTGTGTQIDEDANQNVDPETVKEDKPCVYTADGDKQVCESKKSEENTGQSCGTVNGVETCVPKAPDKNGIDIRTEATTTTNPDGTTTTTKKDTATTTTCKGIKNCTTTTTTVTTTTTKNANGQTTGSSSTCSGPQCPNKSGNPDADGDGFGDCVGGNCGGAMPGGSEVGAQDWFTPGEDTFGSVLTQFSQKVQLLPVSVQTTKFLTFNASGSCPSWSVSTWVFDFDFDQFCTGDIPWSAIAAVIIAAASFLAFRIAFM